MAFTSKFKAIKGSKRSWYFAIPLVSILVGEYIVSNFKQSKFALPPNKFVENQREMLRFIPTLDELTLPINTNSSCPTSLVWMKNRVANLSDTMPQKIPRIIHQTSKSRCLTPALAELAGRWSPFMDESGWSYYFHDDEAIDKLFSLDYPEFPHLKLIVDSCMKGKGTLKADLWRYLVLWVYGGLYADLDVTPNYENFNASSITPDMQGYFVVEYYHLLSQYFMVMAPRHPIMQYSILRSLLNLYGVANTETQLGDAPFITGPHALHAAFQEYVKDAGGVMGDANASPVGNGTFMGTDNTTIVAVGRGGDFSNEHIWRESIARDTKAADYHLMGMKHFLERGDENKTKLGRSCLHALRSSMSYTFSG